MKYSIDYKIGNWISILLENRDWHRCHPSVLAQIRSIEGVVVVENYGHHFDIKVISGINLPEVMKIQTAALTFIRNNLDPHGLLEEYVRDQKGQTHLITRPPVS